MRIRGCFAGLFGSPVSLQNRYSDPGSMIPSPLQTARFSSVNIDFPASMNSNTCVKRISRKI